jgi:hypothetical protein
MKPSEIRSWEAGDLVQIKRGVTGMGDIGFVIGLATDGHWANSGGCLDVNFKDGVRQVHPGNLQAVDGRTRPRR